MSTTDLDQQLEQARGRWLLAQTLRTGGLLAIPAAFLCALAGVCVALFVARDSVWLLCCVALALGLTASALGVARWLQLATRFEGAPDYVLALDDALNLRAALATAAEDHGAFSNALKVRLTAELTPAQLRKAGPALRPAALMTALMLALLPLALWKVEPQDTPEEPTVASGNEPQTTQQGVGAQPGRQPGAGDKKGEQGGNQPGEGQGDSAKPGEVGKKPENKPQDSAKAQGDPKNPKPDDQPRDNDKPQNKGDNKSDKTPPTEAPKDKPLDPNDLKIKPDAGEGEKRAEDRRRWVYDPDGERKDGDPAGATRWREKAEAAIPRLKLAPGERKLLEDWFRKVGE